MNLALTVISSRLGLIPNTSRCGWDGWRGARGLAVRGPGTLVPGFCAAVPHREHERQRLVL